jgi:hypothetical protein
MAGVKRHFFSEASWEVLQEIVMHKENGKFMQQQRNQDLSTNMVKDDVGNSITRYYNKVSFILLTLVHTPQYSCTSVYFFLI